MTTSAAPSAYYKRPEVAGYAGRAARREAAAVRRGQVGHPVHGLPVRLLRVRNLRGRLPVGPVLRLQPAPDRPGRGTRGRRAGLPADAGGHLGVLPVLLLPALPARQQPRRDHHRSCARWRSTTASPRPRKPSRATRGSSTRSCPPAPRCRRTCCSATPSPTGARRPATSRTTSTCGAGRCRRRPCTPRPPAGRSPSGPWSSSI